MGRESVPQMVGVFAVSSPGSWFTNVRRLTASGIGRTFTPIRFHWLIHRLPTPTDLYRYPSPLQTDFKEDY